MKRTTYTLEQLCHARVGHTFRRQIDFTEASPYRILQIKDISTECYQFDPNNAPRALIPLTGRLNFLSDNTILVAARGIVKPPIMIKNAANHEVLAASQFIILENLSNQVIPDYLALYLRTPSFINKLQSIQTGNGIRMIAKKDLLRLQVEIPSIETQTIFLRLYKNLLAIQEHAKQLNLCVDQALLETAIPNRDISLDSLSDLEQELTHFADNHESLCHADLEDTQVRSSNVPTRQKALDYKEESPLTLCV